MGAAVHCPRVAATEQAIDQHRQGTLSHTGDSGEDVPAVVQAHIIVVGLGPDTAPRLSKVDETIVGSMPHDRMRVHIHTRQTTS